MTGTRKTGALMDGACRFAFVSMILYPWCKCAPRDSSACLVLECACVRKRCDLSVLVFGVGVYVRVEALYPSDRRSIPTAVSSTIAGDHSK